MRLKRCASGMRGARFHSVRSVPHEVVIFDNRVPETDARCTVIRKGDKVKCGPETVVRNDDGSTVVRATPILNYIPDR